MLPDKRGKIQRIYIQRVRNIPGFEDRLGNLKITKKRIQQKGVDTLIAVEMLSKAYENHYDIALLPPNPSNGEFAILWFKPAANFVYAIAYVIVSFVDSFKYRLNCVRYYPIKGVWRRLV